MIDIKAARAEYDCRLEVEKSLGQPKTKTGKSWAWNCPFHSDKTPSFHVYEEGYHCFGCGEHGDVFDWFIFWNKSSLVDVLKAHDVDPQAEMQRKAEYAERQAQRLEAEIERAQKALSELREVQSWIRYHGNLDEKSRELWERRGVPEWYQDWVQLGFDPNHMFYAGSEYHTSTLTIPIYEPETWGVLNVKHRILGDIANEVGKYRQEMSGLGAHLFPASPDLPINGRVFVVEGEVKSMVSYVTLADPNMQVIGLPSKNPKEEMIKQLSKCDEIILCLDPDADPMSVGREINTKVRVLNLPDKIDDYILANNLDGDWLKGQLRMARMI